MNYFVNDISNGPALTLPLMSNYFASKLRRG